MNTMNQIFLFDGNCSFCKTLAASLERNSNTSISFVSFRSLTEEQLNQIHPKLNFDVCESEVQYVEDGVRYPGFFAVRAVFWKHKTYKFVNVFLYLPFIPFIGMAVMYILKRFKSNI